MNTIETIKLHAAAIIANGGPKDKNEVEVMKIYNTMTGGKAWNAGKRKVVATGR